MKKRAKPVSAWETSGRGLKGDPKHLMDKCIQPNFPTNIQNELNSLDAETKQQIKTLFDTTITGIENCGEQVFTADEYDTLLNDFEGLDDAQQEKFVSMFFDLHILELQDPAKK